jgi:hypothetical protein
VSTPDLPNAVEFALGVAASMNIAIGRISGSGISYCNRGGAETGVPFWKLDRRRVDASVSFDSTGNVPRDYGCSLLITSR